MSLAVRRTTTRPAPVQRHHYASTPSSVQGKQKRSTSHPTPPLSSTDTITSLILRRYHASRQDEHLTPLHHCHPPIRLRHSSSGITTQAETNNFSLHSTIVIDRYDYVDLLSASPTKRTPSIERSRCHRAAPRLRRIHEHLVTAVGLGHEVIMRPFFGHPSSVHHADLVRFANFFQNRLLMQVKSNTRP